MKNWSRCHDCGALNDHDAQTCYLCGSAHMITVCPGCGAPFSNPIETRCGKCGEPYRNEQTEGRIGTSGNRNRAEHCTDNCRERYLER